MISLSKYSSKFLQKFWFKIWIDQKIDLEEIQIQKKISKFTYKKFILNDRFAQHLKRFNMNRMILWIAFLFLSAPTAHIAEPMPQLWSFLNRRNVRIRAQFFDHQCAGDYLLRVFGCREGGWGGRWRYTLIAQQRWVRSTIWCICCRFNACSIFGVRRCFSGCRFQHAVMDGIRRWRIIADNVGQTAVQWRCRYGGRWTDCRWRTRRTRFGWDNAVSTVVARRTFGTVWICGEAAIWKKEESWSFLSDIWRWWRLYNW